MGKHSRPMTPEDHSKDLHWLAEQVNDVIMERVPELEKESHSYAASVVREAYSNQLGMNLSDPKFEGVWSNEAIMDAVIESDDGPMATIYWFAAATFISNVTQLAGVHQFNAKGYHS